MTHEPIYGVVTHAYEVSPIVRDGVLLKYLADVKADDGREFQPRTARRMRPGVRVEIEIDAGGFTRVGRTTS